LLYPNKRSSCLDYKDTIANLNLIQFDRKEWEKTLDDILIELTIDDIQKIRYTTINSYKGLESDVVFIIDLQNLKTVQDDKSKFLIYTGLSRAKHKLYLLSANS
jgi:superfamily I DNA/RNA helicase